MAHEVETAAYNRLTAWHGLGTVVPNAMTAAEALKIAGIDWIVARPYKNFFSWVRCMRDGSARNAAYCLTTT